ncbi:GNAT family N-acetyltransferase [Streptomyces candidus]|uniref:RimJ/RimL family protein N-acetyltransferase n=1 Tax=Streptomyces candidus TaxID=67283 RepID=A0A7X0LSJ3_9ACTN|nr:GNAT family N-acetyltransferase [Streptomyces candidus]MBB6439738.1 RimJ/RimL family protein N-acetyltransferase [Streptomyces candidus]GHH45914.1 N-acetyltransferase [Streptomyces candidus]
MEQPLHVPELTAGGFSLRPWRLTDLRLVREASEDDYIPLITTVPSPYSELAAVAFIERQWGRASARTGYPFVVVSPDGRPVGNVGLWLRDLEQGRASLGYWVAESARGQGAAVAAVSAVTDWALSELGIPRLELYVEPWNTGSVRTAERAGFQREGLLRGWQQVGADRRDMFMYALLNGER